ncbi:ABC transporter ATP-binding protein [Rhodococcus aetherivorans]|uniref:ABC transporter ATP-binding protein n=1 Tax=Rhodococcus aetherivorans TaxID=191292 RepID=UPI00241E84D2|nr:ABC transporter ATP-binding protein [Rhodococcus aetherivorans]WFS14988.1 ABC transporter ATP-binding protein [Rhodococcus aetherivorans]
MTKAVVCAGLTKDYGQGRGVFDLDLEIERGEILGLVGPNGTGKTTTIRMLMDLIRPDRGSATILGLDSRRDSLAVKRRVGYLPGELPQYPGVTAGYVIGMLAGLRGRVEAGRIAALAERLQLDLGRRYEKLSHGNKQKVHIVQAFMHEPDLLILDEPTLGLDPIVQQEFRKMVTEAVAGGTTVVLSSHVLSEVESVCDRIALIRSGHLLRIGSLVELRTVRAHCVEAVVGRPGDPADLARVPGVTDAEVNGELVTCTLHGPVGPLLAWLTTCEVVELDSRELSLEEVFLTEFAAPADA